MNTTQHPSRRCTAALAGGLLLTGVVALPASARPDAGAPNPIARTVTAADPGSCWLARVATQFVRCDDLTGNGVPAPRFVKER